VRPTSRVRCRCINAQSTSSFWPRQSVAPDTLTFGTPRFIDRPLYLGRSKRLATKAQRLLLYNRDRGCTRPGCTQAACRCQAHHANPSWKDGGLTDAPDLGLGCGPDNQLAELGWTNTIDPTTGRVHWHPPPLMDTGSDTLNHHFHPEELFPPPQPGDEDSP